MVKTILNNIEMFKILFQFSNAFIALHSYTSVYKEYLCGNPLSSYNQQHIHFCNIHSHDNMVW
jgi:hypothetical protein